MLRIRLPAQNFSSLRHRKCRHWLRMLPCLAGLALLAACGAQAPRLDAQQEASHYLARAARDYTPPGTPDDPWGPYVVEAAKRFDVPERWIREVMRVESGGHAFQGGRPITSGAGAMGLMQVMPQTYDDLRAQYGLGDDPYDPHNSILAGAAYIRQMYDVYGSPGFLAAYNAGPKRLDDYLTRNRPLPDETRRYVAMIGPYIQDSWPASRSPAEQLAMNQLPIDIPPGPRWGNRHQYRARAYAQERAPTPMRPPYGNAHGPVEVAALPEPPRPVAPPRYEAVAALVPPPPPPRGRGFHLIAPAMAEPVPMRREAPASGQWAIQVGAFGSQGMAQSAAATAREHAALGSAHAFVGPVHQGRATLYRARLTGLSHETAVRACEHLSHGRGNCVVLSPDAQF